MIIKPTLMLVWAGFVALTHQETMDFGNLDQYKGQIEPPPSLTGSTVWLSGSESDGYDVALSSDTRGKVEGVLDGCGGTLDDKCYQDVVEALQGSELQIDNQLDRRHFGHMLSKTFRIGLPKVGVVGGIVSFYYYVSELLLAMWQTRHSDEEFAKSLFLPHSQVSSVTLIATATTVVISAGGQLIATVTPVIEKTTLIGSKEPSVTAVSTAHGAFSTGDLSAILDSSLASRLDEVMHRMIECADDRAFEDGTSLRKRAGTGYGAAICAVEGAVAMAQRGGPLNDLLFLNPNRVRFAFAAAAGDIARAADIAVGFVLAYAPMLDLPDDVAIQLGNFLFALAVDTLVENLPLGEENRIKASVLTVETMPTSTMTSTTSTSSGCPDPTSTPLVCGQDDKDNCEIEMPKAPGQEAKCRSGEYKGCMCYTPPEVFINMASREEQQAILLTWSLPEYVPPEAITPTAQCDVKNRVALPGSVFGGPSNNVYHKFCEQWAAAPATEQRLTVDANGNSKVPQGQLRLRPRVPPQSPKDFMSYSIELQFKPTSGNKKCLQDCSQAFGQITNGCSTAATDQQVMTTTGSINVECGVFDYKILAPPTTALALQDRQCFPSDAFGSHGDIHEGSVRNLAAIACAGTGKKFIKRDDPSTTVKFAAFDKKQPVQFKIYWKEGCLLDPPGGVEMLPSNPLALKDPEKYTCQNLLGDNYKKCINGGVGGTIQAGCLVYEFKAEHD
ncbi:hypothetical protein BKA64DRAFT_749377 [Cadophora sp. MPI-SDFR-AT-0126]|nr:hypothetical protein BKA64DRAFT_749377 [Leotiomycetes sp. MPI-SDFR-AT-0126]